MAANKETFRTLIREGQEEIRDVELYDRTYDFEENGRYVLVGVRQAGKSYMMYKRAKQMMAAGHSLEEIVYIDFDDERLLGLSAEELDLILQAYASIYNHKPLLFFDEIQNVSGWEHFARRLANQKYHVFITGSNAKMLSRDIQTTLGGRYLEAVVYPYSFHEFVEASGVTIGKEWAYGRQRFEVQQLFAEYFRWGGFPELLLFRNKRHWLNDLYEKILLGDIIQRNKVKNEMALRMVLKRLAENILQPTSYNRLANLVKGTGISTSVSAVVDYVRFAREACIIFSINNYTSKFVEKETVKKHYFSDNGLLSIFLTNTDAPLLENLCATLLYRQYGNALYFYNQNVEVDFYVPDEALAVQVSLSLADEATRKREINALKKLHDYQPLRRMLIVTYDEEETINMENGTKIEVVPAWKWAMNEEFK